MSFLLRQRSLLVACWAIHLVLATCLNADPLKLPEDWFARHVSERVGAAQLSGPVEAQWRAEGNAACLHGDRVFLVTRRCSQVTTLPTKPSDLQELMQQRLEATEYGIECREARTQRVLWRVECGRERPGSPAWFGDFILVRISHIPPGYFARLLEASENPASQPALPKTQGSIRLLDAATGRTLRDFIASDPNSKQHLDRRPWPKADSGPVERYRLDRDLLARTFANPAGPTAPVPSDPSRWSLEDANLLLGLFEQPVIPRCGAVTGLFPCLLTSGGDLFWADGARHLLCRTQFAADTKNLWETPFLADHCYGIAYTGSAVVAFSSDSSVTAYDARTGRPTWTHEWPKASETYSRAMAVLTDGILLLTDPQVPRPVIAHPSPAGTSVQCHAQLVLTKLDFRGNVVFKQELPTLGGYSGMQVGQDAILVYNGGGGLGGAPSIESQFICLAPAKSAATSPRKPEPPADRVGELIQAYDGADPVHRAIICEELAQLGDSQMVDRVINDLQAAGRDLNSRAEADPTLSEVRPNGRQRHMLATLKTIDHERVYYLQALGLLKDPRAIPAVLPLLELDYLREEANTAILAITDGDPLKSGAFRAWRDQKLPELRTRFDQEKYPFEKAAIAAQLRMLQDPTLLDRLVEAVKTDTFKSPEPFFLQIALLRDKRAIPWLLDKWDAADPAHRFEITRAIDTILGTMGTPPDLVRAWWQAHRHLYEQPRAAGRN